MEGGHRLQEGMYESIGEHGMGCLPQESLCENVCPCVYECVSINM